MADTEYARPPRNSGGTIIIVVLIIAALAFIAAFAFGLIGVHQTRDTRAPEVSVSGGQTPAFDVKTAKVQFGTRKTDIDVPKVDVGTTQQSIEVPTIAVTKVK